MHVGSWGSILEKGFILGLCQFPFTFQHGGEGHLSAKFAEVMQNIVTDDVR